MCNYTQILGIEELDGAKILWYDEKLQSKKSSKLIEKPKTKWKLNKYTRSERRKRALNRGHLDQRRITNHFPILNQVQSLLKKKRF